MTRKRPLELETCTLPTATLCVGNLPVLIVLPLIRRFPKANDEEKPIAILNKRSSVSVLQTIGLGLRRLANKEKLTS